MSGISKNQESISGADRELIELLRGGEHLSISQLVEQTGVTATAVRQRLVRLMALGYVDRTTEREGRGRPGHVYHLTEEGRRQTSANNLGDLALVLWQEVQQIEDQQVRTRVISGAIERLSQKYESEIRGAGDLGETPGDRMRSIAGIFAAMDIPVRYEENNGVPVIKVSECPFYGLGDETREICEMEQELITRLAGSDVGLCSCQKDGDRCCSFEMETHDSPDPVAIGAKNETKE